MTERNGFKQIYGSTIETLKTAVDSIDQSMELTENRDMKYKMLEAKSSLQALIIDLKEKVEGAPKIISSDDPNVIKCNEI